MTDFLLELRSEEIPARMQAGARASLEKLFREQMDAAGVSFGTLTIWSTPRRLALIARDMPLATAAVSEELKGPKVGAPPQALEGFLRKTGLTEDQLTQRDGVFFAISEKPGRATADVLAEAIPAIIRAFPWPKSMRWGAASLSTESLRWVRPLSGIVALLGDDLVACEVGGVTSGYATMGHRFHHSGEITIGNAADYAEKLRACHVIVDHAEREAIIRTGATRAAADARLVLVEDEGLVIENAGLTEWPVPLLGRFDAEYLEVPPEVIQLTARTNQKYFICRTPLPLAGGAGGESATDGAAPGSESPTPSPSRKREGDLANAFVCTANIAASDGGAGIIDGNRKVLAARLSDARFFWEQDRKKTLEQHAEKLANIVFHEKLGTVADKVERVAKLARWLVEEGIVTNSPLLFRGGAGGGVSPQDAALDPADRPHPNPSPEEEGLDRVRLATLAEQAARLCKADLVTEMVGEFPELQGLMGGYYARAEGLDPGVADAIRDHYKPVGQGDDVPTAPVTVAVSLADKLDTLVGFFAIKEKPSGSKDPFAVRRAMLGIIEIVIQNGVRANIRVLAAAAYQGIINLLSERADLVWEDLLENRWSPLLDREAAFTDAGKDLLVLNDSPPLVCSDRDENGTPVWDSSDLRRRGLVAFEMFGFLDTVNDVTEFCFDRLRDREKRGGRRPDLIASVLPKQFIDVSSLLSELGIENARKERHKISNTTLNDDVVRVLAIGVALQAFVGTEDGTNLLAGYKRAANILKKEGFEAPLPVGEGLGVGVPTYVTAEHPHPTLPLQGEGYRITLSYTPELAEQALIDALSTAGPKAAAAVQAEDFAGAMAALASLRAPIDEFFDNVTVNDADPAKRTARLGLLAAFRDAVHGVADFSKIEG